LNRIIALAGLFGIATAARGEEGCSKDVDCKGERICVQRQCVEPPVAQDVNAAPADFRPPVQPAQPQSPTPVPGSSATQIHETRHRHLGGFIRPDLGFGYLNTNASQGGINASVSGFAGTFGFAAGSALSENSILAFHFWDVVVKDPSVSVGGSTGTSNGSISLFALGPEYTVYSKENYYFSISPSLSRLSTESSGSSGDTNWGFALRTAVGKEWWVSDHWGLGVASHFSMSFNEDSGSNPPTWSTFAFTVAFSATYN